ncbi:CDF family Co(II)/Ni(II) efflux transporter DmeF [Allorhizobium terrae]|uniref:CDF family Co(II)/Ni(II) efflux transporter DmeF n=1 Tax=Allorhizobium terrae TaxID=1848972 RepID=A0A4S3ZZ70_9HYPH|nr:CDF family Co(II)/Ni(II) efflux transporter DmeF [Allorhizobium terrae]THF50946.1 CDF family Co(II)/Ni(II) efflux transporter DmeF [Allorhizobium terrae]
MSTAIPHDHPHTASPHPHSRLSNRHSHVFLGQNHQRNERRTWAVIAVTTVMMVIEIVAGHLFGSMALTADGWHMATHAGAILVSALAYSLARRNASNHRFTFGTGKFGDLAAFASAMFLGLVAVIIAWESAWRMLEPVPINFSEAILIASVGLVVNLVCAVLLHDGDHHVHHHGGHHHKHHDHKHHDHTHHDHAHHDPAGSHGGVDRNLRAAYVHVLADALTSVLAIVALVLASFYGWLWLDPLIGIVGAVVIGSWAYGLIRDSGLVLLDFVPASEDLPDEIRTILAKEKADIVDLHVWQLGPGHHGAIVSLVAGEPHSPAYYREKLSAIHDLSHVTVEVEAKGAV